MENNEIIGEEDIEIKETFSKEASELFGITRDEMKPQYKPTLQIELNQPPKILKILSEKPKKIEWEQEIGKKKEKKEGYVIEVEDEQGIEYSFWVTPETLRPKIAMIYAKYGTLKNIMIKIWKKEVESKNWGMIPMYFVSEINANVFQV